MKKVAKISRGGVPQKHAQSRERILQSALRSFARDGFAGASIPQIAKMASVAPPLIYYYFGTKDRLWRDTVEYSMIGIMQEVKSIRNATRTLTPLNRLQALIYSFTAFAAHSPDYVIMVISEARSDSDRFRWAQENFSTPLLQENIQILEDAKSLGIIKDVSLEHLAFSLFGGILTYFAVMTDLPHGKDLDVIIDRHAAMIFNMLKDGYFIE